MVKLGALLTEERLLLSLWHLVHFVAFLPSSYMMVKLMMTVV